MKIFKKNKYSILSSILKYGFVFVFGITLLSSLHFVSAADSPGQGAQIPTGSGGQIPTGQNGQIPTGSQVSVKIINPLGNINSIPTFIETILNFVLIVGVPIVTLAIIYCGFLFVEARGNAEKITKAKGALLYTVIGAALLLGSWVIANAIQGTINEIKATP
jgi:hypothetical protein